jgi:hypothetical protein
MRGIRAKLRILALAGAVATCASAARAQQTAPDLNLRDIAAVCSGLQTASASGGRGEMSSAGGFDFQVSADKTLQITQSGQLISKIEKFTYQDYTKCVTDITAALTRPPPAAAPALTVQAMAYSNLDETGVSMTLLNPSATDADLHGLRVGFYDEANAPVAITEAPDMRDLHLARNGGAPLVFSTSAFPRTVQICADIADAASGKTVANKRLFLVFRSLGTYTPKTPVGQFVEATADESRRLGQSLACPATAPPPDAGCSPVLQAAAASTDPVPSRLPELAQQALALARAKAADARLSTINVSEPGDTGRLLPQFTFIAARSGKVVSVFSEGCRLRANVSAYDGSGFPAFDDAFIDLPTAVGAARAKGLRGTLVRADLQMMEGRPRPVLVWQMNGNYSADMGLFYAVAASANGTPGDPMVWRCKVLSMDGSRFQCMRP